MVWVWMIRALYRSAETRRVRRDSGLTAPPAFTVSGRRPSTASTESNSPPNDDRSLGGSSRERDGESRTARRARRVSTGSTAVGTDSSQQRHERGQSSSSGHHRSSTRDKPVEEPSSPLPHGVCLNVSRVCGFFSKRRVPDYTFSVNVQRDSRR